MTRDKPLAAKASTTAHALVDALAHIAEPELDGAPSMYSDAEPLNTGAAERKILAGEEPEYDERLFACDKYDVDTLHLRDEETRTTFANHPEGSFEWWWNRILTTLEDRVPNWETYVGLVTYTDDGNQMFIITSRNPLFGDSLEHRMRDEQTSQEILQGLGWIDEDNEEPDEAELYGHSLNNLADTPHAPENDPHLDFAIMFRPGHDIKTRFLVRKPSEDATPSGYSFSDEWEPITFDRVKRFASEANVTIKHGSVDYTLDIQPTARELSEASTLSQREAEIALIDEYGYAKWAGNSGLIHNNPSTIRSYRSNRDAKADDPVKNTHFTREAVHRGLTTGLVPSPNCTPLPDDLGAMLTADAPVTATATWIPVHDHAVTTEARAAFYEGSEDSLVLRLDEDDDTHYYTLATTDLADELDAFDGHGTTHGKWRVEK